MTSPDHPSMRDLRAVGDMTTWELLADPTCGLSKMRFARGRDDEPVLPPYVDPSKPFTFTMCRHTATMNRFDLQQPSIVRALLQSAHERAIRTDDGVGSVTGLWTLTASYDPVGEGATFELDVEVAR